MKRKSLLFGAALLMAAGVMAQTDVTPANVKFSAMEKGNPSEIFAKDASKFGGNLNQSGTYLNSVVGDKPGVLVVHSWSGSISEKNWADMTAEEKQNFEDFYNTFQIVDGGALGNILAYQGVNSTVTDNRITKNVSSLGDAPSLCFLTPTTGFVQGKVYRFTASFRTVLNDDATDYELNLNIKDSQGNEQHFAKTDGATGDGTFSQKIKFAKDFNNYWFQTQFELIYNAGNETDDYKFLPYNLQFGLGGVMGMNALFFMRDLTIEQVDAPILDGKIKTTPQPTWNDTPNPDAISAQELNNNIIVFANDGIISVVDASAPVEVYNAAGVLVNRAEAEGTVVNIPVAQKGLYLVKVGATTRKVVL